MLFKKVFLGILMRNCSLITCYRAGLLQYRNRITVSSLVTTKYQLYDKCAQKSCSSGIRKRKNMSFRLFLITAYIWKTFTQLNGCTVQIRLLEVQGPVPHRICEFGFAVFPVVSCFLFSVFVFRSFRIVFLLFLSPTARWKDVSLSHNFIIGNPKITKLFQIPKH